MADNGKNGELLSLMLSSWGSGGPEIRKRLVTAFSQNDHFTLKVGLPRNSQYVDFACNPESDTLLHLATRRTNEKSVKMLLRIGADPNARNKIGRTPLHEAALTGNLKILQLLVEYGGDLRLHDAYHQTPRNLTAALAQGKKMDISYYIEVMRFLSTCYNTYETEVMVTHRKLKDLKKTQNTRAPSAPLPEINCLGFGVFCTQKDKTSLISCVPFVRERELIMVFNRYPCANGPFTVMMTMTMEKNPVSVRKLRQTHNPTVVDILITECSYQRRLRHPGLLFLMAVFNSVRLDSIGLVFEHISVGSLYTVLHTERSIFPPKKISYILCQICEALIYIHKQNLVHNNLSSYAIQLVNEKTAKLTNFEYMNYVNDSPSNWLILREERSLKDSVWRWSSPELLLERIPSFKSDLFSFCCILWEMYHRAIPWKDITQQQVKQNYHRGETLSITSSDVKKILKMQLTSGLNAREQYRNLDLEEIRMTLIKESVKTFVERGTDSQTDLPSTGFSYPLKNDNPFVANLVFDLDDQSEELIPEFDMTGMQNRRQSTIHFIDVNRNESAEASEEQVVDAKTVESDTQDSQMSGDSDSVEGVNEHGACKDPGKVLPESGTVGKREHNKAVSPDTRKSQRKPQPLIANPSGQGSSIGVVDDPDELLPKSGEGNRIVPPESVDHNNPRLQRKTSQRAGSVRKLINVFETQHI